MSGSEEFFGQEFGIHIGSDVRKEFRIASGIGDNWYLRVAEDDRYTDGKYGVYLRDKYLQPTHVVYTTVSGSSLQNLIDDNKITPIEEFLDESVL